MNLIAALVIIMARLWTSAPHDFTQVPRDRPATPPSAAAPTGTASISGTVVADDDQHPLALANVVAIGAVTGTLKMTSTDRDGRFVFANLPADRYVIGASRPPYVGAVAGARRPARPGVPIVVGNGQKIEGVAVRLPKGAVIAGTIVDDRGRPVAGAMVGLQQWKNEGDDRVLANPPGVGMTGTDNAGRYRLSGLPPGEYVVTAYRFGGVAPRELRDTDVDDVLAGRPVDFTVDPSLRAVPFYFPGSPRPAEATAIAVAAGDERLGVDFSAGFVRAARVDGTVFGLDGQPLANATIALSVGAGASAAQSTMTTRSGADGRFTLQSTVPAQHVLTAFDNPGAMTQFASMRVDTANGDQSGLQVMMRPPMTMAGRLQFEGDSKPSPANRMVPFRVMGPSSMFFGTGVTMPNDAGDFQFVRVAQGRYLIGGPMSFGAHDASTRWALKSVMADDKDITDLPLPIVDSTPKLVVITYTDQWQQLSGKLSHQSGAPASDETVIVFPKDRAYWYQGSRRILTARPGSDGLFSFGGQGPTTLPPGEYLLAAVMDLGRDEQFDPSLLAALEAAAAPLTIRPGEKKIQDLVIR